MHDQKQERLNALVQTQLTTSARDRLAELAAQRYLTTSALVRIWIMEQLEAAK